MLISKRRAGLSKRGSVFNNPRVLTTSNPVNYTWTLVNENCSFTFISDEITGAKLSSFNLIGSDVTWSNSSRTLWSLDIIRDAYSSTIPIVSHDRYEIFPTKETFSPPSVIPVIDESGNKSFTFTWNNIKYNKQYQNLTCNVTLVATLNAGSKYLDISLTVESNQPIGSGSDTESVPISSENPGINTVCVSAVHMPRFIFKGTGDEEEDKNIVLSLPVGIGHTIQWPHKYFQSPRFIEESYHYTASGHRVLKAGLPLGSTPQVSTTFKKLNFGVPGWMSLPACVYGSRTDQEGFIIYNMDPDGLHAKGWQFYSDDKGIHISMYDCSDHEIDPYGMGGKHQTSSFVLGNRINEIGWTVRILPFSCNTRWVDWYGWKVYKEQVVPENESNGWLKKSFYQQAQEEEIDERDAEVPLVLNIFGHMSGNAQDAISGARFWQDVIKTSISPEKSYLPRFTAHMQPISLASGPYTGTTSGTYSYNYWSWESWAQKPLGQSYGPEGFKSPDHLPINSFYTEMFSGLSESGILIYPYYLHSFPLSSGSTWVTGISGIDLIIKEFAVADRTFQYSDYHNYARTEGQTSNVYPIAGYISCLYPDVCYEKHIEIASGLASVGAGAYHDTFGNYGRGCYAHSHVYRSGNQEITVTHPRGKFTHFYNSLARKWMSGFAETIKQNSPSWVPNNGSCNHITAQGAEFITEANLSHVPGGLYQDAQHVVLNTHFDLYGPDIRFDTIDNTFDATAYFVYDYFNLPYYRAAYVEKRPWLQKCPSWSIVYGDRSILNYWLSPHISNAADVSGFFSSGPPSGVDNIVKSHSSEFGPVTVASYATVRYPQNHDYRLQEMRSWFATDLNYVRRVSVSHFAREYVDFNPVWSGIRDSQQEQYTSPAWSGFFNYIKQYIRLTAYEPDYFYHGDNEHPLESWTVDTSQDLALIRVVTTSRKETFRDPDYTGVGYDTVYHSLFRKRDSDSLMMTLNNWFSGTKTFSFNFDPSAYDISNAVEVYELDLTEENHGTKTLLDIIPNNSTTSFNLSVPAASFRAIEFSPLTNVLSSYYSDLTVSYVDVNYSYAPTIISTASVGIPYSYGSSVYDSLDPALIGFRAPATQQIANNLPHWVEGRQKISSNMWKLINSWGMSLEDIILNTSSNIADIWLLTSDLKQRKEIFRSDINSESLIEARQKKNLLFNSSFSIKDVARNKLPAGWTDFNKNTATAYTALSNNSTITSNSIKIKTSGLIGQIINLNDVLVKDLVGSIYVLCNSSIIDIKLIISIEYTNGNNTSYSATISSRSNEWRRLVLPINNLNSKVRTIKFVVSGDISTEAYICAPMLEYGNQYSNWSSSDSDGLPYYNNSSRFNSITVLDDNLNKKIPLFCINNEDQFIRASIPTRISKLQTNHVELEPFGTQYQGRKVDYYKQVYEVLWNIKNNKISESSDTLSRYESFSYYDLRDLRFYYPSQYGTKNDSLVSYTLLASCTRSNILYLVSKEVFNGETKYILKIINPRVPPNGESYLESLIDFDLELDFSTQLGLNQLSEEVTTIGFSEVNPNYMVINTSLARRIYYKLYFDYYYFDPNNNQLYTTENYNGAKLQIL